MSKSCSQMASSSSRRGKKAAHLVRNASPNGWISDDEERYKFGCYRKLFKVVPHKFLDVELFRREGFIFQEWLVDVGLLKFVEMTDVDRLTTANLFLVHAVETRIPTNWVAIMSEHMIEIVSSHGHILSYGVFINRVLKHHQVDLTGEKKNWCTKSNEIGKAALRHNGLKKTKDGWVFKDCDETPSTFTPQNKFERFVVDQFRRLSRRISKVENSLIMIHTKSDEDNALITPSAS
ncbi:uncharacterized protein HKW66_Vig0177390 [Vigna angularis]|uniref:Uncharacterized protein n=1 Tax=Phaseolus angularis TaxID=3914 RepID=A0A8T0JXV2_PHAAN|nr:uncharacterized protein HKW66_Vig0177390 [Vigna angularis]